MVGNSYLFVAVFVSLGVLSLKILLWKFPFFNKEPKCKDSGTSEMTIQVIGTTQRRLFCRLRFNNSLQFGALSYSNSPHAWYGKSGKHFNIAAFDSYIAVFNSILVNDICYVWLTLHLKAVFHFNRNASMSLFPKLTEKKMPRYVIVSLTVLPLDCRKVQNFLSYLTKFTSSSKFSCPKKFLSRSETSKFFSYFQISAPITESVVYHWTASVQNYTAF